MLEIGDFLYIFKIAYTYAQNMISITIIYI